MGRLLAFILGALALLIYVPPVFLGTETLNEIYGEVDKYIDSDIRVKILAQGPGILVGIALFLFAVRGKD